MNRNIVLTLLVAIGILACKNSEEKLDRVEIAKLYYKVLDDSDYSLLPYWFSKSLTTIEGEFKQTYPKNEYLEFLKWDSVFDPSYEILEIEQNNGIVKAKISKIDKRISFLHEKPFITHQTLKFKNDKIISIEIDYVNFNETIWEKNKNRLIDWTDKNHPELKNFINDQTESGGIKFLKAIELYQDKE